MIYRKFIDIAIIFQYSYRIEFDITIADLGILSGNRYIEKIYIKLQYFGLWLHNRTRNKEFSHLKSFPRLVSSTT